MLRIPVSSASVLLMIRENGGDPVVRKPKKNQFESKKKVEKANKKASKCDPAFWGRRTAVTEEAPLHRQLCAKIKGMA